MASGTKKLKREVGNWVDGDRFWDRVHEFAELEELLAEGANVLIVAPRRVGKTSLMHETARRLKDEYHCLVVDLQKGLGPADALVELSLATREIRSLWERTREVFKNALDSLTGRVEEVGVDELSIKLRGGVGTDWQARGTRLFAALAAADKPVVLFLDEFPILVNRILKGTDGHLSPARVAEADAFVSWIRSMSQAHRGRIRMVLAGSIGLEPVLRQAGLSATLNSFTPFHLEPWDAETAVGALRALAAQYDLSYGTGAEDRMVALLGSCIPHHVQMFFSFVYEHVRRRGGKLVATVEEVEQVYQKRMLSTRGHAELSHMEERLALVLAPETVPLALDLLTEAAVSRELSDGAAREIAARQELSDPKTALRDTLAILEHDGYLERREGGFVFLSALLRDWWAHRFGSTHEPVS